MELLQLRYFVTVGRMEHMTKAAQELRIAQPALSKTISRLEEDVGVPLFDRQGGRIRLNPFGKLYLDKVERALNLLDQGQKEVTELAGLEHGSIHLATSTIEPLSEALNAFLSQHPNVGFRITQASTEELARLIEDGEADICFTALPLKSSGISGATVLKEDIYLAVPKGHRLAGRSSVRLSEAAGEPFIGYSEDFVFQQMNDAFFHQAGIKPKYVCRVDESSALASLVRAGLGVALFGCKSVEDSRFILLPIEYPVCQRHYQILWHDKRYLSLASRKFRDFVIEFFAGKE